MKKTIKFTRKELDVMQNIISTHTLNLNYPAILTKVGKSFFIFVNSSNTFEENKFILFYTLVYFARSSKDTIIDFSVNLKNIHYYKRTLLLLNIKKFFSKKLNKLVGDIK